MTLASLSIPQYRHETPYSYALYRAPSTPDHFRVIKQTLEYSDSAHSAFSAHYSHDCFKLITLEHFQRYARFFFTHMDEFYKTLYTPSSLHIFSDAHSYTLIQKGKGCISFYVFFRSLSWKGSFKVAKLGLEIGSKLSPCGFTYSSDEGEILKEIKVRTHSELRLLSTPTYLYHSQKGFVHGMVHGWASGGTLCDYLKKPLSLVNKDKLVILLLDKMAKFHKHALHKDLSSTNLLVDETGGDLELYINDFGSSILGDDPIESKVMSTRSLYLAPEMIRRSFDVVSDYDWEEVFEGPFTQEDWIYQERFQIGILISEIYLGQSLYHKYHKLKKPVFYQSFAQIRSSPKLCHELERYAEDHLAEFKSAYQKAFQSFYWTLIDDPEYMHRLPFGKHNMEKPIDSHAALRLPGLTLDLVLKNPEDFQNPELKYAYDLLFEEFFCDLTRRSLLESYLDLEGRLIVEEFYKKAYAEMKAYYFKALAKFKADCDEPMIDIVTEILAGYQEPYKEELKQRLIAALPLLDYDPKKRPPLESLKEVFLTLHP